MSVIASFLKKNKEKELVIHVIGDSLVDQYFDVKVTRISPESPNVCVMLSETDQPSARLPGGAANVCYQLTNFAVKPRLFTWIDDEAEQIFNQAGIQCYHYTKLPITDKLPRKNRFFDGNTQVSDRWDIEKQIGSKALQAQMGQSYEPYKGEPCVVILSDYNKGTFAGGPSFLSLKSDIPTIVDPKKGPLSQWKNCTIFKPNEAEAIALSHGLTDWKEQCDYFQDNLACQAVVITQSGKGVVGKDKDRYFEHRPAHSIVASKIMGAGDCFVGVLALAIGHGFSVEDSAHLAFEAGSLYVQNESRNPITLWQLQKHSKYITPEDLLNRKFKLAMSNGCWDILHSGHLESLRFAKSKGDRLLVAVNSDESVKRLKGPKRPVVSLEERMELLAALECVDYVISFDEDSPQRLIEEIKPEVLIKGGDWKDKGIAGSDVVKEIYFCPLIEDKSTTNIIEKIKVATFHETEAANPPKTV